MDDVSESEDVDHSAQPSASCGTDGEKGGDSGVRSPKKVQDPRVPTQAEVDVQHTDGSDHDEQRSSLDRTETASQPEEPVMNRSQRERQHHVAEHSMKPKNGDGRWVTILRGPNPSGQRRNDEKEAKEHSQQQARQEQSQQKARVEQSQQHAREEQGEL